MTKHSAASGSAASSSSSASASAPKLAATVFATLERDAMSRRVGVNDDLFPFSQLQFNREWDNSLPTLVQEFTYSKVRHELATLQSFREAFYKDFPGLESIDMRNILFAGGCVGHYLTSKQKYSGDIDVFVYGLTREAADERVHQFACELVASVKEAKRREAEREDAERAKNSSRFIPSDRNMEVKMIRNANGLSLFIESNYGSSQLYQVIFRLYASKSEILHGFDIGSSAVGFDGADLYFTTLSRFSYEFMCNILDTTRRSTTYEQRLEKYWRRGFRIILPFFNMSLLRLDYLKYRHLEFAIMPGLVFGYEKVVGNRIVVKEFCRGSNDYSTKKKKEQRENKEEQQERGDGEGEKGDQESNDEDAIVPKTDYDLDDVDEYNLLYINLTHLLNDPAKMYHFHRFQVKITCRKQEDAKKEEEEEEKEDEEEEEEQEEEEGEEDEEEEPQKKKQKKEVEKKQQDESVVIRAFFDRPPYLSANSVEFFYRRLREKVCVGKILRVGMLEKYVTVEPIAAIVTRLFVEKRDAKTVLDDVVARQQERVLQLLQTHAGTRRPLQWITENPGTQLTSSFSPIVERAEQWYGTFFVQRKA